MVDLPFVPVITIDFLISFFRKNKSKSVIIFFLFLSNSLLNCDLLMLIPGLIMIKSTTFKFVLKLFLDLEFDTE